jgi:hypothetical protein
LIYDFQKKTICLIKDELSNRLTRLDNELTTFKEQISQKSFCQDIDMDDLWMYIESSEEEYLKDALIKNKQRAERCVVREFKAKVNNIARDGRNFNVSSQSNYREDSNLSTGSNSSSPRSVHFEDTPRRGILKHGHRVSDRNSYGNSSYRNHHHRDSSRENYSRDSSLNYRDNYRHHERHYNNSHSTPRSDYRHSQQSNSRSNRLTNDRYENNRRDNSFERNQGFRDGRSRRTNW